MVDVAPFDAISSSGVRASDGSRACSAGRVNVTASPTTAGEREHEDPVVCERGCGGGGECTGTEERQYEQKALAAKPIAERSGERCDSRCRQQPNQPRDAHRGGTALLVSKDAERDEMRPLGRNRRTPGEFHPPNVLVSKSGSESRDQLDWLNHEFIESVAIWRNNPGPLPS